MVVGVEDVVGDLALVQSVTNEQTGETEERSYLNLDGLVDRVVRLIEQREKQGKSYGVVVLAEGLVELLPPKYTEALGRDDHGHISLGMLNIGRMVADLAEKQYQKKSGIKRRVVGCQLGYEARCAAPHAFDVMLGCQLGQGAYRAIVEKGLDGHMVSVSGQLDLRYVPFNELVDPKTLVTKVRYIESDSDFFRLAHSLATRLRAPNNG